MRRALYSTRHSWADRTAAEVKGLGRRAAAVPTDVTSRADLANMVDRAKAEFGRIDILVNNAGIYRAASTLEITEEHWDSVMTINAKAVFFASQAVLPTMIAQKSGAIVSLASMAGRIGSVANLPYNASKAAVISMTKSLALAHAADAATPAGHDGDLSFQLHGDSPSCLATARVAAAHVA